MTETLRIRKRFNGPHDSGNGGYSAGLAAQLLPKAAAVEVTLRAPIPLEQTLRAHENESGLDIMTDDASTRILIMSLKPSWLETPNVQSPGLEAATVAAASYRNVEDHVLPHCFVCGPARAVGDGLRIFPDWLKEPSVSIIPTASRSSRHPGGQRLISPMFPAASRWNTFGRRSIAPALSPLRRSRSCWAA